MQDIEREDHRMSLDSGMIVVIMISLMYMVLVFGLLFYVKNDWCDLLFSNFTINTFCKPNFYLFWLGGVGFIYGLGKALRADKHFWSCAGYDTFGDELNLLIRSYIL